MAHQVDTVLFVENACETLVSDQWQRYILFWQLDYLTWWGFIISIKQYQHMTKLST